MLGSDLCRLFGETRQVIATDLEDMDVGDHALVFRILRGEKPDLVIHLAGITDVDRCEEEPDLAYSVNALGTRNVALACQDVGSTMF